MVFKLCIKTVESANVSLNETYSAIGHKTQQKIGRCVHGPYEQIRRKKQV